MIVHAKSIGYALHINVSMIADRLYAIFAYNGRDKV